MGKKLLKFAALLLAFALCVPSAAAAGGQQMVRVGLAYGSSALLTANLENNTGYGSGYRFGYFDSDLQFVELGTTKENQTKLTVLKTTNLYQSGNSYNESGTGQALGCFHVVYPGSYADFEQAHSAASQIDGGFVAWVDGSYQVRAGAYLTEGEAKAAAAEVSGGAVKGTSAYGVNVVSTGSTKILFQFDGGAAQSLGILPDVSGANDVRTWFQGYKYRGGFRYQRVGGGNLTVVNLVDLETYIRGVIPYEMSNNWPLEALKSQAVCARSYANFNISQSKHRSNGFDVCATTDCQVYRGAGSNVSSYQANEYTDRAVTETAGEYAWLKGTPIEAYYSSSHGGASEDVYYAWGSSREKYPYLCGVDDPYEQAVNSINPKSSWKVSYTAAELTQRLQGKGFGVGTSLSSITLVYSPRGNVIQMKLNYANGQSNTIYAKSTNFRSLFGVDSIRFTINGQAVSSGTTGSGGGSGSGTLVNGSASLGSQGSLYVISGAGTTAQTNRSELYAVSGTGVVGALGVGGGPSDGGTTDTPAGTTVEVSGNSYVFQGSGWGHQLGMSQYGAYAMANQGFAYNEIVEFYFPGTTVGTAG